MIRGRIKARDIMNPHAVVCSKDSCLQEVARLMVDADCGEILVVDSMESMRLVGVVTDRDIVTRTVAIGIDPLNQRVAEYMTFPCVIVTGDSTLQDCCQSMQDYKVRRLPIVSETGRCMGVVGLTDLLKVLSPRQIAELLGNLTTAKKPLGIHAAA